MVDVVRRGVNRSSCCGNGMAERSVVVDTAHYRSKGHDLEHGADPSGQIPQYYLAKGLIRYIITAECSTRWSKRQLNCTMALGIEENNRTLLDTLHRRITGPFGSVEAAESLGLSRARASRLLAYLGKRGWLARVRRGLYTLVPLGAGEPAEWREDPWIVAAKALAPCYIGGWSACEHWELTEQIFRDVVVVTGRSVRSSNLEIQGTAFRLKSLPTTRHFGTRNIWKARVRVAVSDPTRTIIDVLDDPSIGGGIRHIAEVVDAYFASEHRDDGRLVEYTSRRGNRTVFKRLGYLVEALGVEADTLVHACRAGMSAGLSLLDPSSRRKSRVSKRWNLRVNADVARTKSPS